MQEEVVRKERNRLRLMECYPTFWDRLAATIATLEAKGYRPRIQEAWRSPQKQAEAVRLGHSRLRFGYHNVASLDGKPEALAADVLDDDSPLAPGIPYLLDLARAAEAHGLGTGIRLGLPKRLRFAIDRAIRDESVVVTKVGWDPLHVQVKDVTVAQAKSGMRPT